MIFNFTKNHQFHTRVGIENVQLEVLQETKLLGCIITPDLKWRKNTDELVRKGYQRLLLLHKLYSFNVPMYQSASAVPSLQRLLNDRA